MKVLVIAPHPDDEILGCGGIMAKRAKNGDDVYICVVTEGKEPMYSKNFIKNEEKEMKEAHKRLKVKKTICLRFPSAKLDSILKHKLNENLSEIVKDIEPDEVYIPHKGDMHFDHQIVAEAAMVAVRPKNRHKVGRILSYEVLSETDWNDPSMTFRPNVYEDISDTIGAKLYSLSAYESQLQEPPAARSGRAVQSLAAHRGAIIGTEYAEAFELIREVIA